MRNKKMIIITFALAVGLVLVGWGIYLATYKHPSDYDEGAVSVGGASFRVDFADTAAKRSAGLSGREPLRNDEGMYFLFASSTSQAFWMKDMKFPIDIVWIREGRVVGVTADVPPPGPGVSGFELRPSPGPVEAVLEISAGHAAQHGIGAGDAVTVNRK